LLPVLLPPYPPYRFPDPRRADGEGLVAIGGDLAPERLLVAYAAGIFPWSSEDMPLLWWSPDPRAILPVERLRVSRSLQRTIRRGGFELTFDVAFRDVIEACAAERTVGTWILPEMIAAYERLHRLGAAHSFEVWRDGVLVGGLYGVQRGALFAAESMFHRATDMSKVALVAAVRSLCARGIELFEVQFVTPHLASMGAVEVPRAEYLARLATAVGKEVDLRGLVPSCDGDAE
jgi:leucyl/phenylalanyl-tRNA--protein transferase